jgi:hypothetical protein
MLDEVAADLLGALGQHLQFLECRGGSLFHDDMAPASNKSMHSRKWEVGVVVTWTTSGRALSSMAWWSVNYAPIP